jgi:hypothetical protein
MIDLNPSDEVLQRAHLITLYDPQVPAWHLVVVDRVLWGRLSGICWLIVDVPVDSTNPNAIQAMRDRIERARSQGQ